MIDRNAKALVVDISQAKLSGRIALLCRQ